MGLKIVKLVDLVLSLAILATVIVIAAFSFSDISAVNIGYSNFANLLLPYGVILFAFSSATTIPEAHALLKNRDISFQKAIIIAGLITTFVYVLFAFVVVGVTGPATSEIATIGLGHAMGSKMVIFGNVFAFLAMASSFLIVGISLKDSLVWDYKIPRYIVTPVVLLIPFIIFLFGIRQFIQVIDIVGGVFVSLQLFLVVLIYWRAKHLGHLKRSKYNLHHTYLLAALILLALSIGTVYSVMKLF